MDNFIESNSSDDEELESSFLSKFDVKSYIEHFSNFLRAIKYNTNLNIKIESKINNLRYKNAFLIN